MRKFDVVMYHRTWSNSFANFFFNLFTDPSIPRCCPSALANIMKKCWDKYPEKRPEMEEDVKMLEAIDTSKGGGMLPVLCTLLVDHC